MAKRKYEYNMGDFTQKANETDLQYYRRLAKQADQRLVRLEAYSHERNFQNIKEWSYARALTDITKWSGPDAQRFNTAPPMKEDSAGQMVIDEQKLRSKIKDIKTFLEAPTSTKKGVIEVYKNRVAKINKDHGTNFTWQEFAQFTESATFEQLDMTYASRTKLKAIGTIQKAFEGKKGSIKEKMEEVRKNHVKLSDDGEVNAVIEGWMKIEGFNWDDLK